MQHSKSDKYIARPHAHTVSHSPRGSQQSSAILIDSGISPRRDTLTKSGEDLPTYMPCISEPTSLSSTPSDVLPVTSPLSTSSPATLTPLSTSSPSSSGGHFNFLAFRRAFTTKELTSSAPLQHSTSAPAARQKSYFVEEHMSFKDSNLKPADLTSLSKILNDKVGMITFRNFLRSIYAEENLKFWCDVAEFKKNTPPDQIVYEARKIYVLYIHDKAAYPLNVASTTRRTILGKIENDQGIDETIFDEAQEQAYDMMHQDCFPRFRKSPYFYRMQEGLDENFISAMAKKTTGLLHIFRT